MESKFDFAKKLIKEAGVFIKDRMTVELTVEEKTGPRDLVTNLDKSVQEFLVAQIKERFPSDLFFAEESEVNPSMTTGHVWVIDPIDGTVNFIAQQDDFAVMLAYYEDGLGRFGLIYDVMADKLYSGGPDLPVTCNGKPLPVYQAGSFHSQLIICNAKMYRDNDWGLADMIADSLGCRTYGSAGISMARVLEGKAVAYFSYIYPWDYAAASIIGQALGYRLLTLSGEAVDFVNRQKIMFLPKILVSTIQSYLNESAKK